MKSFGSDNHSGIHPQILRAIENANIGHVPAYGDDAYTTDAIRDFRTVFGEHVEVFFVFNGTGANCLSLLSGSRTYNSIICVDTAHINVDECAAPEKLTGCKIISVPHLDGKLTVSEVKKQLHGFGFEHHAQPKFLSISQSTELGTVYNRVEIEELATLAHDNNMFLHMDGARFANAIAASGIAPKDMVQGVDVLSFGGTKNGMMIGEAVVFFNPKLAQEFKYLRKQSMQLSSKMRFISAQFSAYFKDDLWIKMASNANQMASLIYDSLKEVPEVKFSSKPQANALFAIIPTKVREELLKKYCFYVWDENTGEVRWVCSFDTTTADVEAFVSDVKKCINTHL